MVLFLLLQVCDGHLYLRVEVLCCVKV